MEWCEEEAGVHVWRDEEDQQGLEQGEPADQRDDNRQRAAAPEIVAEDHGQSGEEREDAHDEHDGEFWASAVMTSVVNSLCSTIEIARMRQ